MTSTLAKRIKFIIKKQGITQTQFAESLGVSQNYVSQLVIGKKQNLSLSLAKLIESLYGYPTEWILEGKNNENEDYTRQKLTYMISKMSEEELSKLEQFVEIYAK